jgi:hypothetical protein
MIHTRMVLVSICLTFTGATSKQTKIGRIGLHAAATSVPSGIAPTDLERPSEQANLVPRIHATCNGRGRSITPAVAVMLDPGAPIHPAGPAAEDDVLLDSNAPLQTAALASASIPGPIPPHSEPVDDPVSAPAVPIPMREESLQHPDHIVLLLTTHPTAAQRTGTADVMSVTAPGATSAAAGSTGAGGSSSYGPSTATLPSRAAPDPETQQQQSPAGQAPVTPALKLPALRTGKPQQLSKGPSGGGRRPVLEPVISGHPLELRELAQQVEADTAAARDQQPGSPPHTRPSPAPAVVPSSSMGGVDISAALAQADTAGSSSAEAVLQQQREQQEGTASRAAAHSRGRGAWFRRLLLCCTTPDAKDDQMVGPAGPGGCAGGHPLPSNCQRWLRLLLGVRLSFHAMQWCAPGPCYMHWGHVPSQQCSPASKCSQLVAA